MLLANLATLATAIFAGAAVYISLVEQPARMECSIEIAVTQWRPSHQRAAIMQASLAVLGSALALMAWTAGAGDAWLLGGLLLGAVLPFTLLAMRQTNRQLADARLYTEDEVVTRRILGRWGWLHAVRSGLGTVALVLMLFTRA